jgi:heat shock protein HslJ
MAARNGFRRLTHPALFAVLVATLLAACTPTANDTRSATAGMPDPLQQLTAHEWLLDPGASSVRVPDTHPVTLTFGQHGVLSGLGPCNTYRGTFTIDRHELTIEHLATTKLACAEPVLRAEQEYLTSLAAVHTIDATDRNRLVLKGTDTHLAYDAIDLHKAIDADWHVVTVAHPQALTSVAAGTNPVLSFHNDGSASLTTGCGTLHTTWRLDGGLLTMAAPAGTNPACTQPRTAVEQHAALAAALAAAHGVQLTPTRLTILDPTGSILLVAERGA